MPTAGIILGDVCQMFVGVLCIAFLLLACAQYCAGFWNAPPLADARAVFEHAERQRLLRSRFADAGGRVCCDDRHDCERQLRVFGGDVMTAQRRVLPLCACGGVVVRGRCYAGVVDIATLERLCAAPRK